MIEGVKRLCKDEYGIDVAAKVSGSTLAIFMPIKGLFDLDTMQVSTEAFGKVDGVMLSATRIALSGIRDIEFYTIITADEDVPGAEVIVSRHVGDLRRFIHRDISRGEFSKRMVIDVRFNPQAIIDKWSGDFTIQEIKLDEFMCQQAARRIKEEFQTNKTLAGKFKVVEARGRLQDKAFVFNVDITREGLPMSELLHGKEWHKGVLLICAKKIAHVIWAYSFKDYRNVSIANKFDNKILEFDKKDARQYRKKKIEIE